MTEAGKQRDVRIMQGLDQSSPPEISLPAVSEDTKRIQDGTLQHQVDTDVKDMLWQGVRESLREEAGMAGGARGNTGGGEFVGFSTAAGKAITVSEAGKQRAAQFMQALGEDAPEDAQTRVSTGGDVFGGFCVAGGSDATATAYSGRHPGKWTAPGKHEVVAAEERTPDIATVSGSAADCGFAGFSTAGGKVIKVSEAGKRRAAQFMQALGEDAPADVAHKPLSTAGSDLGVDLAGERPGTATHSERPRKEPALAEARNAGMATTSGRPAAVGFAGFSTAGGKVIKVSEAGRQRAARFMQALEEDVHRTLPNGNGVTSFSAAAKLDFAPQSPQQLEEHVPKEDGDKTSAVSEKSAGGGFGGFCTAAGKAVMVSEAGKRKGAQFMRELLEDTAVDVHVPVSAAGESFGGFRTAGGTAITVSEAGKQRAAKFMRELGEDTPDDVRTPVNAADGGFGGFCTAAGKAVTVSEAGKQRGAQFMRELGDDNPGDVRTPVSTADGNFGGFCTAAGKAVTVSEASKRRARQLLEELEETDGPRTPGFAFGGGAECGEGEFVEGRAALREIDQGDRDQCAAPLTTPLISTAGKKNGASLETALPENQKPPPPTPVAASLHHSSALQAATPRAAPGGANTASSLVSATPKSVMGLLRTPRVGHGKAATTTKKQNLKTPATKRCGLMCPGIACH
jgi:hypothetical protein